jgi:DNA-binding response OmpR family regulator
MTAAPALPSPTARWLSAVPAAVDPAGRPVTVFVLTEDGQLLCSDPDRIEVLAEQLARLVAGRAAPTLPPRPRRAAPAGNRVPLRLGRITLEPDAYAAVVAGRRVALTAREFDLLLTLARSAGRTLTRPYLLRAVWQTSADPGTRTVDVHVTRLRRKLGPAADQLVTVRGVGYRLEPT